MMKPEETRAHLVKMVLEQGVPVQAAFQELDVSLRSATRLLSYVGDTWGALLYDPLRWSRHADSALDR